MGHPNCPICQLNHYVIKAGLNRSCTQRYRCQDCARYFTPQPKPQGYDLQTRKQAVQLYLEGTSYRAIGRLLNVHNQSVINWVEAAQKLLPDQVSDQERTDYVEVAELFSFVEAKKNKSML